MGDNVDKYSQLAHPIRVASMPARYSNLEVQTIVELPRRRPRRVRHSLVWALKYSANQIKQNQTKQSLVLFPPEIKFLSFFHGEGRARRKVLNECECCLRIKVSQTKSPFDSKGAVVLQYP